MNEFTLYIFSFLLVVTAIASVEFRDILSSVIALTVFSIVLTAILIGVQAPDVAMAEAAVSTGFLTALFVITISKVRGKKK